MRYYVIKDPHKNVAVLFHDYVSATFIIRSISEGFRRAFESGVSTNSSLNFQKGGSKLKYSYFGPQYPTWVDSILSKICGNFWTVCNTGNTTGIAFVEDIVSKHLPLT